MTIDSKALEAAKAIEPVAWITKAGLSRWLEGTDNAEQHVLLRRGNDLRTPLYASPVLADEGVRDLLLAGTVTHRGSANHGSSVEISFAPGQNEKSLRLAELLAEFAAVTP